MTAVEAGIRAAWEGRRGGYNVTIDFSGGPEVKIKRDRAGVDHRGSSHGKDTFGVPAGGDIWFLAVANTNELHRGAGHEFGHVMGISDSPWKGHLMNKTKRDAGPRVTGSQMQESISKCMPTTHQMNPFADGEEQARYQSLQRAVRHSGGR